MKATRRAVEILLVLVCGLLAGVQPCYGQCSNDAFYLCLIPKIDVPTSGIAKLRSVIAADPSRTVLIEKLLVANVSSGVFLQQLSTVALEVSFELFRETSIQLLGGNTLQTITIYSARNTRSFVVAAPNNHLEVLQIEQNLLDRIPTTLRQLNRLKDLRLGNGQIESLPIDALANNRELVFVDLNNNRIDRIIPSRNASLELPVKDLRLTDNLIQHLDMAIFNPFKLLQALDIRQNRLVTVSTSVPVTLANLSWLHLDSNRLSTIDLVRLTAPMLSMVTLYSNNFTETPTGWGEKKSLSLITLSQNAISTLDFGVFRSLTGLKSLSFEGNRIRGIRVNSPPVHFPLLMEINLSNNNLSRLDLSGTDFPKLYLVMLSKNRLTGVPQVFRQHPDLRLTLWDNPVKCSTLLAHRQRLETFKLQVSVAWGGDKCPDASIPGDSLDFCCTS